MKLNKNQQKWLDLLRSNTLQQGYGALKLVDKEGIITYCCLGVACEALEIELEAMNNRFVGGIDFKQAYGFPEYGVTNLPPKIGLKLKITKKDQNDLITSNDIIRDDFTTIANQLEELWRAKHEARELAKSIKKQKVSTGEETPLL